MGAESKTTVLRLTTGTSAHQFHGETVVTVGVGGVTKREHFFIMPPGVASTPVLLGMPFIYNTRLYMEYDDATLDIRANMIFGNTRVIVKLGNKGPSRSGN